MQLDSERNRLPRPEDEVVSGQVEAGCFGLQSVRAGAYRAEVEFASRIRGLIRAVAHRSFQCDDRAWDRFSGVVVKRAFYRRLGGSNRRTARKEYAEVKLQHCISRID